MQAIMLAAGKGTRLGKYTENNTKCMLEINNIKLIDRAIETLRNANIYKLILVLGYKKENVKNYLKDKYKDMNIIFIDNDEYDCSNNIYSLYLAKDYLLNEDTILLESDLIYENTLLQNICNSNDPNLAVVAKYEQWMDGTVITTDENDYITQLIGKNEYDVNQLQSYYKTVNIYKFCQKFLTYYFVPYLEKYINENGINNYYEMVLKLILNDTKKELKAFKLKKELWYEIDNEEDLKNASRIFNK